MIFLFHLFIFCRGYKARKDVQEMKRVANNLQKILRATIKQKTQKREEDYQRNKKMELEEKEKNSLRLKNSLFLFIFSFLGFSSV